MVDGQGTDFTLLKFKCDAGGVHTISNTQVDKHMFAKDSEYTYSKTRIIVVEVLNRYKKPLLTADNLKLVKGYQSHEYRDCHTEVLLQKHHTYVVYSEVLWNKELADYHQYKYGITCYGPSNFEFENVTEETTNVDFLREIHTSIIDNGQLGAKMMQMHPTLRVYRTVVQTPYSYMALMYQNRENADFKVKMQFQPAELIEMLPPDEGNAASLLIEPGQRRLVIIKGSINN